MTHGGGDAVRCWNITKAQKTEMMGAPASQWKMNTALPEDETRSRLQAGMFELGIRLPEHSTRVCFVCSQNVAPVDKCHRKLFSARAIESLNCVAMATSPKLHA